MKWGNFAFIAAKRIKITSSPICFVVYNFPCREKIKEKLKDQRTDLGKKKKGKYKVNSE